MTVPLLLEHFDELIATPEDVERLNDSILQLALQGKLVEQSSSDESGVELLQNIFEEKKESRFTKPLSSSDFEEPFNLPHGWAWARLGDIIQIGSGKNLTKSQMHDTGKIPVYGGNGITGYHDEALVHKKTIVIGRVGFYCGSVHLTEDKAWVTDNAFITEYPENHIHQDFLVWLLKGTNLKENENATAQPVISGRKVYPIVVGIPPLKEQQRIASRLKELFAQTRLLAEQLARSRTELDRLNESALARLLASETQDEFNERWGFIAQHFDLLTSAPKHIAPLRQSILELALRGKLTQRDAGDEPAKELLRCVHGEKAKLTEEGKLKKEKPLPPIQDDEKSFELPYGWEWVRLGNISKSSDYGTSEKASEFDQVPMLRMNNIQNGRVLLENLKYVPDSLEELPKLYLKSGDLLFNRTNSYELVGKTGIFKGEDDKFTFASYLIRVTFFKDFVNIDYINTYFNSSTCRLTQIEPHITQQTGQANFNGTKLKNIVIPLPPLAEQERIVKRVEQLLGWCDALEAQLANAEMERGRLVESVLSMVVVEN